MADKEKKVKKKKVEKKDEAPAAEEAPAPAPEPEPAPETPKRASSRGSRKAPKRSGSSVFSMFSNGQIAEFKEGFQLMDKDKDGIIGKNDMRATYDLVGKLANDKELDDMLAEAPGPVNFTQMLSLFASRMSGGADDDETIIKAIRAFDEEGVINGENFRSSLMSWGDRLTEKEVADCFENFEVDDEGNVDTQGLIELLTGSVEDE